MPRQADLDAFYDLLADLEKRVGGMRRLGECHGRLAWPQRGVYFFFEPGEYRNSDAKTQRVVRVGTHALTANSRTTLWKRISQHRGTVRPRGGNHRGSIFRLLVGEALMIRREEFSLGSWGNGSSTSRENRDLEREHEARVSEYLGDTTVLFLSVPDLPGAESQRGIIERNSIALLSNFLTSDADMPSQKWLGQYSKRERVVRSGLWNNRHVDEIYDPDFLKLFKHLVDQV